MGMLADGQTMLNRRLKEAGGLTVVYSRGLASSELTARLGNTLFSGLNDQAIGIKRGQRDYLIEVADLVLDGEATTPHTGDRITEADAETVWEVCEPVTGEPAWRYSDQGRTLFRVHCRRANA